MSESLPQQDEMDPNLKLVRRCLTLIGRIALRGANSPDTQNVLDTLFELSCFLSQYPFNPQLPDSDKEIRDLRKLHQELDFIDSTSQEFTAHDMLKYATTSTCN